MAKSQWSNKYSIMKDLVEVTQGKVPIDLAGCITADKPQAYFVKEEIDDEYFQYCSGDANFARPDLASITQMLSMVQEVEDDPPECNTNTEKYFTITKLNGQTAEVIPKEDKVPNEEIEKVTLALKSKINTAPKTAKGKGERNVALASLLKVNAGVIPASFKKNDKAGILLGQSTRLIHKNNEERVKPIKIAKPIVSVEANREAKILEFKARIGEFDANVKNKVSESNVTTINDNAVVVKTELDERNTAKENKLKLLKPEDFMPTVEAKDFIDVNNVKVEDNNGEALKDDHIIVASKTKSESIQKVNNWMSGNVKKGPVLSATSMFKRKSPKTPTNTPSVVSQTSPKAKSSLNSNSYVPTPLASEYYKKFKEMVEVKNAMKEDIWTRAERKMKEIDGKIKMTAEKKVAKVEEMPTKVASNCIDNKAIPQYLYLPQHRHLLTGECVVCKVLCEDSRTSLPGLPSSTDDDTSFNVLSD